MLLCNLTLFKNKSGEEPMRAKPKKLSSFVYCFFVCLLIVNTSATEVFDLSPLDEPDIISNGLQNTNKVKMLMIPDRTLIAIYRLAQPGAQVSYDIKSRTTRAPWDLLAQYSTDEGFTWSAPVDFDNTAMNSSSKGIIEFTGPPPLFPAGDLNEGYVDLLTDPRAIDFPGDSDKPQAFNAGNNK